MGNVTLHSRYTVPVSYRESGVASWGTHAVARTGHVSPQRACPARCKMLSAAFTSRSSDRPQEHDTQRSAKERFSNTVPQ